MSFCSSPERKTILPAGPASAPRSALPMSSAGRHIWRPPPWRRHDGSSARAAGARQTGRRSARRCSQSGGPAQQASQCRLLLVMHLPPFCVPRVCLRRAATDWFGALGDRPPQLERMMSRGGGTTFSGAAFGALMRRSRGSAASSPISRAPIAMVVSAGRQCGRLGDVVEADDGAVAAGDQPAVGEAEHERRRRRRRCSRAWRSDRRPAAEQRHTARGALLAGRQAIDDRADRQAIARQRLAIGDRRGRAPARPAGRRRRKAMRLCPSRMRCSAASVMPTAEVGADVIGCSAADPPQHLHDGQAGPVPALDDVGSVPSAGRAAGRRRGARACAR